MISILKVFPPIEHQIEDNSFPSILRTRTATLIIYESSDSEQDRDSDSSSKSDTSSLIWDNVETLQLGEYILEYIS